MIHQLLNLTRPLFILDTETTGTNVRSDRIIEFGFQEWMAEGMIKEWRTLLRPGIPIPAAVTAVHGITDERLHMCNRCGRSGILHPMHELPQELQGMSVPPMPTDVAAMNDGCPAFKPVPRFKDVASSLVKGFTDCDFAGKNIRFDLQILSAEFLRAGIEWSYSGARIVDIDRLEQIAIPRTLAALHEKYTGRPHDGAHGALSDARASATVIVHQLEVHNRVLPRNLDELHRLQWAGWIDSEGKFRFVDGVPCFGRWGKYAGRPMADPEVSRPGRKGSYWDFILGGDFAPDVKKLAAEAKLGRFPVEAK